MYGIADDETGMVYVGQTLMNFGDRRDAHMSLLRNGKHWVDGLQEAWRRSDGKSVRFFIIEDTADQGEADSIEKRYIERYESSGMSFNTLSGGKYAGWHGKHLSEGAKKKIGEKNRVNMTGRKASEETRRKMSEARAGRTAHKMSDESRRKSSVSHQGEIRNSKLRLDDVVRIRELHDGGMSFSDIARMYGVTSQCISGICSFKRWAKVYK